MKTAKEYYESKYPNHTRLLKQWVIELMEAYTSQPGDPQQQEEVDPRALADELYEGCDGCTEVEEKMWKNGFVRGYHFKDLKEKT